MAVELEDREMTLVEHLDELRTRLIYSLVSVAAGTCVAWSWTGEALDWLARPVGGLVFLAPTEAFFVRFKLALFAGFMLALPVVVFQAWAFTARALGERVRRSISFLIPTSYLLFLGGVLVAVLVVVPTATKFLVAYGTENVKPLLSAEEYVSFVGGLAVAFGAVFQLPLVLLLLERLGIVHREALARQRRVVYFLGFVAAAMMTPGPDVISQLALALPIAVLFELSLLAMRLLK
jgi:sec-independent protein translocase protein TatC